MKYLARHSKSALEFEFGAPQKNNWLRCEASKLALRFQEVLGFIKRLNGERSLQYLTFCQSFIHYSKNSCEWVIVSAWNQSTPAKRKIANPRPRHVSQFENEILLRNAMNSLLQKERIGFLRSYTPAESKSLICRRERRRPARPLLKFQTGKRFAVIFSWLFSENSELWVELSARTSMPKSDMIHLTSNLVIGSGLSGSKLIWSAFLFTFLDCH